MPTSAAACRLVQDLYRQRKFDALENFSNERRRGNYVPVRERKKADLLLAHKKNLQHRTCAECVTLFYMRDFVTPAETYTCFGTFYSGALFIVTALCEVAETLGSILTAERHSIH